MLKADMQCQVHCSMLASRQWLHLPMPALLYGLTLSTLPGQPSAALFEDQLEQQRTLQRAAHTFASSSPN